MTKAAKPIDQTPSPEHLAWSIKGRARTQECALELYSVIKENPKKLDRATYEIEILTAIAFSLWRAVFLADRFVADKNKHATSFLNKMLVDNNISFAQDRSSRSWTYIFYARTAEDSLAALAENWPSVARALKKGSRQRQTPRNRWDRLQGAFEAAVKAFATDVRPKRNSN